MDSRFDKVKLSAPFEIFAINKAHSDDKSNMKVNISIGAYRDEEGKPWVLPVVREVEKRIADDETLDHEYLPLLGLDSFIDSAIKLILGDESNALLQGRTFGVQSLSGTGALRIGAEFLRQYLDYNIFYYSEPGYDSHYDILMAAGFDEPRPYRYWNEESCSLDIAGFLQDLSSAPEDAVIVLHACSHNPTGHDPTPEQWIRIADIMEERRLFPFFDATFQGLASGDIIKDAWPVRYFADRGFELFCVQSFSKSFGLYGERIGNLTIVVNDVDVLIPIKSQMVTIVKDICMGPPMYGARVVTSILNNIQLYEEWQQCLRKMVSRLYDMRRGLVERLQRLGTPGKWDHILAQKGMFTLAGITPRQVEHLIDKFHIYLPSDGRINICGLNNTNIDYVAKALHETILYFPKLDTKRATSF